MDRCDAKKIITTEAGMKKEDVLERLWPKMTAEQIDNVAEYVENGKKGRAGGGC